MTADDFDRWSIPDQPTDLLGTGYVLGWCITRHGHAWPWVLDRIGYRLGDPSGCRCPDCAPHEQDGPLPTDVHERVAAVLNRPARCGGRRTNGHPCRSLVRAHGDRCHWHQPTSPDGHTHAKPTT